MIGFDKLGADLAEDSMSAARRHFHNAEALKELRQMDNAGHLIGFAAECGIKLRISTLHPEPNAPQGHFPELLIAARKHLGPRSGYTKMYDVLKSDIFKGWTVNRRYEPTGTTSEAELSDWFQSAKRLFATANLKARK